MKKKLLGIFIIIACILCCPKTPILSYAETEQPSQSLDINTLYPENILDYQNLNGINNITINQDYVVYNLNDIAITVLNKTTKEIRTIDSFNNIIDFKITDNNLLIIIDHKNNIGNVKYIDLNNANLEIKTLSSINTYQLYLSDIYYKDNFVYVGIIKKTSPNYTFELYKFSSLNILETPEKIDTFSCEQFNTAYNMTINENKHFVLFENTSNEQRIIERLYGSESITPTNILNNIQIIDYYNFANQEYLVAFTMENLCLISTQNFATAEFSLTNLNLEITDIDIYNGIIYISDDKNDTICSYLIKTDDETTLENSSTLISSAHSSVGRFNGVSDMFIQNNSLFISDTNNDRIQIINQDQKCTIISSLDVDIRPHATVVDSNRNIYFAIKLTSTTSAILKYTIDSSENYTLSNTYSTFNTIPLGLVSDSTISNNNEIYIIDYSNNQLLLLNTTTGLQSKYTFPFTTNENTKIEYLRSSQKLIILNNNKLYLIDPVNLENNYEKISATLSLDNCIDITADTNAIYTLHNNKVGLINIIDNTMQLSEKSIESNEFSTISTISFDIANRQMYGFNQDKQCIVYFETNLNEKPFDFSEIKNNVLFDKDHSPIAIKTLNNAIIYDSPYYIGSQYLGIENCIGIETFEDYYRVLFEYDNVLTIGFLHKNDAQIISHNTQKTVKVITTNLQVPVYKFPTILKYNNQAIITSYIPINTQITISYTPFPISIDSKLFYTYEINDKVGFIFNADVVLANNTTIVNLHHNNASIKAIGEETIVIMDEDKTTPIGYLKNDDLIYVETYDKDSEFTKIIYKDSNLNTITGYVKTDYIEMDEIDNNTIILILVIVISVIILITIVVSYIIIKKKK